MKKEELKKDLINARDSYIDIIKADMLGPGSEFDVPDREHELISSSPVSRYSMGILFPQGIKNEQDNDETVPTDSDVEMEFPEDEKSKEEVKLEQKTDKVRTISDFGEDNLDEEVEMASQYKQSSIGMTFMVIGNTDSLKLKISYATYQRAKIKDCCIPYNVDNPDEYSVPDCVSGVVDFDSSKSFLKLKRSLSYNEIRELKEKDSFPENESASLEKALYKLAGYINNGYVRVPHNSIEIPLSFAGKDFIEYEKQGALADTPIKLVSRKTRISDEVTSVTIMLVNTNDGKASADKCIFQPIISVDTNDNDFKFVKYESNSFDNYDYEEKSLALLYRNKENYGTGLGVSLGWKVDDGEGVIWTDFFPVSEVPQMDFNLPKNSLMTSDELSMKYLSDLNDVSRAEKIESLNKLIDTYSIWIKEIEKNSECLADRYKETAAVNITECKKVRDRMLEGINTLLSDDNAYIAFELANRAMFMQRVHIQLQQDTSDVDRYSDDGVIEERLQNLNYYDENDSNCRWRPFQLAFMLMDIDSIVNDNHPDRDIVDLIWFPTGGGKTEAYLGLTAFTIFYRKLQHPNTSSGTAVMMRYTLRLLASQQFTRASTLICACEYIRKDCAKKRSSYPRYSLGEKEISIGLWIGGSHIPNKNKGSNNDKGAKECLDKLIQSSYSSIKYNKEKYNKFQVLKCPWCGTKMTPDYKDKKMIGARGYGMKKGDHFYMFCPQEECDFTSKLPIQVIDEELYDNPPTLLFGTVDKFAMMPWDVRVGSFFGQDSDNRTPDLIIQDELHLISGSLGTIVGLYETAIDNLCSSKGVRPKIIASTATIRRAKEQCSVLYNRDVVQFPPPGIEASDSFFSREAEVDYDNLVFGRKYVGIMPSGRTKAMTEIRMTSSLLQRAKMMDLSDEIKDKLWTITVYFNSLKDLGKASTMVEDDVKDFIIRIANRLVTSRRLIISPDELTSRVSTTELNETLDKLEKVEFSSDKDKKRRPSDVLLATNMISVGIDVARLNVMLMIGQPKLTSEYIQASSRVGRSYPGVAFVQYDATKSRDRSHYEKFKSYHESYYRYVEPTGATPFSKPARERAIHAVLLSILRQSLSLGDDSGAIFFNKSAMSAMLKTAEDYIVDRIKNVDERAGVLNTDYNEVYSEMNEFIDFWQNLVDECEGTEGKKLFFGRRFMVKPPELETQRRLIKQYNSTGKDQSYDTLTSMRNVDTSVTGEVIIWER